MSAFDPPGARRLTVSVIIPTYQRREHVTAAVQSALNQSHPPSEVIVVDDGSTDGTAQALAIFDGRVRYVYKDNGGPSSARNAGLALARGEVVAFLDADDRWRPNHLGTIAAAFIRHPEAIVASTCPGFRSGVAFFRGAPALVRPLPRLLIGSFVGYPSCTAARRDVLLAVGGFDEDLSASEAYDLWLRVGRFGPYSLAPRRTVIRAALPDSLLAAGIREGRFLDARERISEKVISELGGISPGLDRATRGHRRFVAALRALDEGDTAAASGALAEACRLMPEMSDEPWLVGGSLSVLPRSGTPRGRLAVLVWAAQAWPEPASDTALGLRLHASYLALRCGQVRLAARILRGSPLPALLRYGARLLAGARSSPADADEARR